MIALCLHFSPLETDRQKQRVVFVDNLVVFGVVKASVRDRLCQACESFDKLSLKTHEQEVQSGTVTCLGNQRDCVEHRSTSHGCEVLASQEGS